MRHLSLFALALLLLGATACPSPRQRWEALTEEVQRTANEPKTPEAKCQQRGGVFYNDQCYTEGPGGAGLGADACRLRGGLYVNDRCLFSPQGRAANAP